MKKVRLILGTVNSCSLLSGREKLNEVYENSYKPFLVKIHKNKLPITLHYSGELLSWLIDSHDGMQMLFNDLLKQKRLEILGGGYYSPLFSLIPRKDRVEQIEAMTTDLRKRFGKRPRGMWITEKVWEPSMPMTMNNAGMEFTFLDEEFFENAGLFNGELYQACITEDQGKTVSIFPVSNRLISQFNLLSAKELVEQIIECGSEKENRIVTMLMNGEDLVFDDATGEKMDEMFRLIDEKRSRIEVVLPGRYVREIQQKKKVYFGCVSPGDIGRWSGPVFRENTEHSGTSAAPGDRPVRVVNTQSFFRHFLSKYPESNNLYSRMIDVHLLVSQLRGDRQRKKTAALELHKSQNHSAFWHGGGEAGIYSAEVRRKAYSNLIEAEKITREKSGFRASLIKWDFDMDGLEEIIYRGLSINTIIHKKGGTVTELDYFRRPHNYLATMARHREWYHNGEVSDTYPRSAFIDHFFQPDEKMEKFIANEHREGGDFISGIYQIEKISNDSKEALLFRNGSVNTKKSRFSIRINKAYSLKRNVISIEYEIINNSDTVLNTLFGTEINLALSSSRGVNIDVAVKKNDEITDIEQWSSTTGISEIQIQDQKRQAVLFIESEMKCGLWTFPLTTSTGTGKKVEQLYQSNCFVPLWSISLGPGKVWKNRISLRIERLSRKNN